MRSCIGCRSVQPACDLLRVTRREDGSLLAGGPSAGRGVWVGPAAACLAASSAHLRRGLRAEVTPQAIAALAATWESMLAARGRDAEPPPGCVRERGNARRGQ
ncbi:MAG: DUF448 domain-containing protein [Actinobacteria bacterium]|nr:DUF448 domain-containing protein [Actinomycetota bacterium]MSW90206.1 DUF448 domain-containing protein [Actinomycetota bacterium]MSX87373.1 DUF448 domain-containing protein [Actinomycetota bacterium]MSY71331.1 DUF448 domain-containing protein [Actinomycetota bacterium]